MMVTASPLLLVNAVLSSSIRAAALFSHKRASAWSISPFCRAHVPVRKIDFEEYGCRLVLFDGVAEWFDRINAHAGFLS